MEQKIIGGEFSINSDILHREVKSHIKPEYSLGRTCLYSILRSIKGFCGGGVLLPDYLCSSIAQVPAEMGFLIGHYHVSSLFVPDIDEIRKIILKSRQRFAILLISYFGLVDLNKVIDILRNDFPDTIIIVDDVQNYYGFGIHSDFDYCFTSYRKWFAVPDGADVLKKDKFLPLERYPLSGEYVHYKAAGALLKNHREIIGDTVSLKLIEQGESLMDAEYLFCCSDLSIKLFNRIDFDSIAMKRQRNAKYLHEGLEELEIQHIYIAQKVPLFIPIIIKNRDEIRKHLFSENIFSPVHWPLKDISYQGNNELYRTELSLICDQRYDEDDMEKILRGIKNSL